MAHSAAAMVVRLPSPETCPTCGSWEQEIIRTRIAEGGFRYRRRKCRAAGCGKRWNTYETILNPRHLRLVPKPVPAVREPEREPERVAGPRPFLSGVV